MYLHNAVLVMERPWKRKPFVPPAIVARFVEVAAAP
jgi:hypothetical protein